MWPCLPLSEAVKSTFFHFKTHRSPERSPVFTAIVYSVLHIPEAAAINLPVSASVTGAPGFAVTTASDLAPSRKSCSCSSPHALASRLPVMCSGTDRRLRLPVAGSGNSTCQPVLDWPLYVHLRSRTLTLIGPP